VSQIRPREGAAAATGPLARPIIVVAPPRAGARLLARALGAVPGSWTAGGEPGALLSGVPALDPPDGGEPAGRLTATDCRDELRRRLRADLRARFASADPTAPHAGTRPRLFDASPRNALMVPFLDAVFPDAVFVYVHRDPRDALAESLAIWRSGEATTYPRLPGWSGPAWSFLLVPGWRELIGRPLAEIVTEQWVRTMRALTADLEALAPSRWCVTHSDVLAEDPMGELARLLGYLGLGPSESAAAALEHALSTSAKVDVRSARSELRAYLSHTRELDERAGDWLARGL
jgi:hypothetical protein